MVDFKTKACKNTPFGYLKCEVLTVIDLNLYFWNYVQTCDIGIWIALKHLAARTGNACVFYVPQIWGTDCFWSELAFLKLC